MFNECKNYQRMDRRSILGATLILGAVFATGCDPNVYCTQEFRQFEVTVVGAQPTRVYTVDLTTGDTLFNQHNAGYPAAKYGVGSDFMMQTQGVNTTRTYSFVVEHAGGTPCVVPFVFQSDECHISKVSGPDTVQCP